MKPTDDSRKVALPAGATMEKDPSAPVAVPVVLPFTEIDTPARPTLSVVEITLPVIVRSCANENIPKNNKGIISKQLIFDMRSGFYFVIKET
jgi:hypothetical protein